MNKLLFSNYVKVLLLSTYSIWGRLHISRTLGPWKKEALLFGSKLKCYFGLKIGTTYFEKKWFK